MKKLLFIFVLLLFFANVCQAEQYYCGDDNSTYNISNMYYPKQTAREHCKWLKTDIIISDEPIHTTYKKCVSDFNAAKTKYDEGLCTPVIEKTYPWNGYKCKVKSIKDTPQIVNITCNFEDKMKDEEIFKKYDAVQDYFHIMYYRQFNMNVENIEVVK